MTIYVLDDQKRAVVKNVWRGNVPRNWHVWGGFFSRLLLGVVFLTASIPKIIDPFDFLVDVQRYQFLGATGSQILAIVLPWVELLVGACLISGIGLAGASTTAIGMFVMFAVAQISVLYHGLSIDCGCHLFASSSKIGIPTLLRTIGLLLLAVFGYWYNAKLVNVTAINKNNKAITHAAKTTQAEV